MGRVNDIAVDPTTTVNGSIVAYLATSGGGVWKTTDCCSASTTWTVVTDNPLISTTAINTIVIDPNNHKTIYAGTGDLRFAAFAMVPPGAPYLSTKTRINASFCSYLDADDPATAPC